MLARNQSIERQMLNTYKKGFYDYLVGQCMYFKKRDLYMSLFSKCFSTANIESYNNIKIPHLKLVVEDYARKKNIDLTVFDSEAI